MAGSWGVADGAVDAQPCTGVGLSLEMARTSGMARSVAMRRRGAAEVSGQRRPVWHRLSNPGFPDSTQPLPLKRTWWGQGGWPGAGAWAWVGAWGGLVGRLGCALGRAGVQAGLPGPFAPPPGPPCSPWPPPRAMDRVDGILVRPGRTPGEAAVGAAAVRFRQHRPPLGPPARVPPRSWLCSMHASGGRRWKS